MSYKHLFFDLDHTLWDYDMSASQTLSELYLRYELDKFTPTSVSEFTAGFFKVNTELWDKYNTGDISKYYLRTSRFKLVFEAAQINLIHCPEEVIQNFNSDYLRECPMKGNLLPGTKETLDVLKEKYKIHIITNGFEDSQRTKLDYSGLHRYIDKMITSETAKSKKPQERIFKYALEQTGATKTESIMIGDNLNTDIKGARDFGMDQVFFNPNRTIHKEHSTYEISGISDLLQMF